MEPIINFKKNDAVELLKNKRVYLFGDSNTRAMYKDLVWLCHDGSLLSTGQLRGRLETTFAGDTLLSSSQLHARRDFSEHRAKVDMLVHIEYHFLTHCFSDVFRDFLKRVITKEIPEPDVVIYNSCVWDMTRWGPHGPVNYQYNIDVAFRTMKEVMPNASIIVLTATPPSDSLQKGGFFHEMLIFLRPMMRWHILHANAYVQSRAEFYGLDVLDFHHATQFLLHKRRKDGIHWNCDTVRYMSNLILSHLTIKFAHMPVIERNLTGAKQWYERYGVENWETEFVDD